MLTHLFCEVARGGLVRYVLYPVSLHVPVYHHLHQRGTSGLSHHLTLCLRGTETERGGVLRGGVLRGGVLRGGVLRRGVLKGGVLRGGVLRGGVFCSACFGESGESLSSSE
jgi:hypothetical protein